MIPVWPKIPLQTIYDGLYDGPHATPKESANGAIFLGIKNVAESGQLNLSEIRYIAEDDMPRWTKRVLPQKDDIVFSYEATLHRYARIPEGFRGCLGRRMALIRVDQEKVDVDFLFSYFLGPLWRCEVEKHILSGATVDRIPLTSVPDFDVYLPPLPTQQKIARILSAYDDLIENNLKRIKLLEEMAQITYEQWFVRMKFPGHETTPMDAETELPEGWDKKELREFGKVLTGKTPPKINEENYGEDVLFIKIPDMAKAPYVLDTNLKLSNKGACTQKGKFVPKNTLLVSCIGTVGVVALTVTESQFNQQINAVVCSRESDVFFLYCFAKNLKPLLEGLGSNGATMTNVNKSKFERIQFIVPTVDLLQMFSNFAGSNFATIEKLLRQNQLLKEARDILLPRLMTGMIDVDQIELPDITVM